MTSEQRLRERAMRKVWPREKLQAKLRRRDAIRTVGRNVLSPLLRPVLEIAASAVPGGTLALRAVVAVVDRAPEVVDRAPVLSDVATVGDALWREHVEAAGGDRLKAVMRDLAPAIQYIEDGDWPRAIASIALLAAAAALIWLI